MSDDDVRVEHEECDDGCYHLKLMDGGEPLAPEVTLHETRVHGWTALDLIEGLVTHLRYAKSQDSPRDEDAYEAIKHLERAWSALNKVEEEKEPAA